MNTETYNEFCYSIEKDAIWLDDDFFIRLTPEVLDMISDCQLETDSDSFKTKWMNKIGEKVFFYDNMIGDRKFTIPLRLSEIPYCNKEDNDLRLAEKDSLTRMAARKYAQYLYNGNAQIDEISDAGAIAMMLFLRNGMDKRDFWKIFRSELANSLEELLNCGGSLDIEDAICQVTYNEDEKFVVDFVKMAEELSEEFHDEAFHLVDDELIDIILKAGVFNYKEEELKKSLGQYAIVHSEKYNMDDPKGYMSRVELEKQDDGIVYANMDFMPYFAAESFIEIIDDNDCETDDYMSDLVAGIALFKKNGKTSADFWKSFCSEAVKSLRRGLDNGNETNHRED